MTTPVRTTADRFLLPSTVTPSHYSLELTPDLVNFTFAGTVDIDVTVHSEGVTSIDLHCHEIITNKVSFTAADGTVLSACGIAYDIELTTVTFRFPSAVPTGAGKIHIEYTGILNDQMAGFYRSKYTDVEGNDQYMAATQFEALDARRAFPCWDEPAMKATFSVTMIVPWQQHALSNMPELSCTHLSQGRKKVVFDVTPVMSTYLLAFAVGVWDVIFDKTRNGVTVSVFSPPGRGEQGRFALNVATKCLDFYDDFFKVNYPLPKLDMLVITEFAAGAMENWGLVTYREAALLIKDADTAEISHKQRVSMIVCHELAHQWFGNLVTMGWWCDLWLNEGFAAFMQHFATDFIFPEWKIWEQYTIDTIGAALKLDGLRSSHPIMVPIYHAKEVEQVFDAISYNKGSTIVRMAQYVLGTTKFREGLQLYCKRHAYSNTETSDLWQAWSEVSGIDMSSLMTSWTQQLGYPYIVVDEETWTDAGVSLKLKQGWFLNDGSEVTGDDAAKCWSIPLLIASSADVGNDTGSKDSGVMDAANIARTGTFERVLSLPKRSDGCASWVKLNANQSVLLRVSHTATMISRLTTAILRGEVSAIDRAALVDDQFFLGMTGRAPMELFANCLPAFRGEANTTVWKALAPTLTQLLSALQSVSSSDSVPVVSYKNFAKDLVMSAFNLVGWDAKEGEDETFKLMRGTIFSLVEAFCADEPSILAEARRRFSLSLTVPADEASQFISSDIKGAVYRIVLSKGSEVEFNQIMDTYKNTSEDAIRKWALTTLGSAPTRALKVKVMEWALSGDVKLQDLYQPMMSVSAAGAEGREVAWTFFKDNFAHIQEKVAKANIWTMTAIIVACTSKFSTHELADEMEAFFVEHPVKGVEKRVSQIIERTRANAGLSEQVKKSALMSDEFWQNFGK